MATRIGEPSLAGWGRGRPPYPCLHCVGSGKIYMLDDAYWNTPEGTPSVDYTTAVICPRCNGTATDPEHAWPEDWPQVLADLKAQGLVTA